MSITHTRPSTTVVLFQGADLDPLADRRAAFQRATLEQLATGNRPLRIGDDGADDDGAEPGTTKTAREHDEFLDGAIERATKVKMAAMPRKPYGALLVEHPPREDKRAADTVGPEGETIPGEVIETFEMDAKLGYDVDGISEPLVLGCLRAWDEDVRPEDESRQFDTDADLQAFLDDLSIGDFSKLVSAAIPLNQSGGPDPKARLSSLLDRT